MTSLFSSTRHLASTHNSLTVYSTNRWFMGLLLNLRPGHVLCFYKAFFWFDVD